MSIAKSQISKKVLSWVLVFALVVSFTPTIGATHEDDYINVENAVFPIDNDGLANDLAFLSHVADDEIGNITINVWKKNALGNWEEYDDGETNETGELTFFNATSGEYMWDAYNGNNKIDNEGGFAVIDTLYSVSHVGMINDFDGDEDTDDFIAYIFENNETSEDGYVEIYDEGGNLFDNGYTDEELDDNFTVFLASNLDRGNYTHYIYEEYNGTLIQNGSFYSYGNSTTTSDEDSDEWFEDWDYETEDTNDDEVANKITIYFNPDTDCNCSTDVYVGMDIYNNDTNNYIYHDSAYFEINGTEEDEFSFNWSANESANFTFQFYLYDDQWNFEDNFEFTEYLECDKDNVRCKSDEWFEDWDYDTEDTNGDDVANKITIYFDPNTDCDCSMDVNVSMDIYNNDTHSWVDYDRNYFEINGTEEDEFSFNWSADDDADFKFKFYLYDDQWNFEDSFDFTIYLECDTNNTDCDGDEWFSDYDYEYYNDTFTAWYDPDTTCECNISGDVHLEIYENETGNHIDMVYQDYTIYSDESDWFSQDWTTNRTGYYDIQVILFDENHDFEDDFWVYDVYLESGDDNGTEESDEWFEDRDYYDEPSDTIHIEYDPNTDCYCEVRVWVYIDVYQDGNKIDTIADDYYIYYTDDDWFEQGWTAEENGTYDFKVVLFDGENGPDNYEDEFWIYDVYLSSGDNGTDDDGGENGIGHIGEIVNWEEDGFVNDYIGAVTEGDEFRKEAYFEIYSLENDEIVDSGNAEEEIFTSLDLPEGDYVGYVYYEENGEKLQASKFHSYGNSSGNTSTYINVDMAVLEDEEEEGDPDLFCEDGPCDEAFFKAHRGSWDNGVSNVTIEICTYENNTGECEYYDTVYTNETGEASSYDGSCSTYEWSAIYEDNEIDSGTYEIWACGDDDGDNETEDYNEWFEDWEINFKYDQNGEHEWNKLIVEYNPDTVCDCDVDVEVYIDVVDNKTGDYVGSLYDNHLIYNGESEWFTQEWTADYAGKYDFHVELYDSEYGHPEDSFQFSVILSDEWFFEDFNQDGSTVHVNLNPQTEYDGEIWTFYDFYVFRLNENNEWESVSGYNSKESLITSSGNEEIRFEWNADEDGIYRFEVYMYDEYDNMEHMADFEVEINLNSAPVIHGINVEQVFEGQMFNFEVDVTDENGDNLEFSWDMGDGTLGGGPWGLHDDSIMYVYPDDGEYIITVKVSDGNGGRAEENFIIWVMNTDPILQVSYDDFGQEGQTLSFTAQTNDVPDDNVLVTWTFPDGTQVEGNFVQYRFVDDGEFMIGVTAEDEDGGRTSETLVVTIENVAPIFTEFQIPSTAQEGETLDFTFDATDPGDDTIVFNIDFGDGTAPTITQDGNVSHRFAEGDSFTLVICAKDEDGGETCRQQILPVSILEQLEEEGLLPGFNLLLAISALGVIGMLRRRTH